MNIKAVAQVTGVSASTLRKWEERYGVPRPERTAREHRRYSEHDLETIVWLKARLGEGYRIREAVVLLHDGNGHRSPLPTSPSRNDGRLDLQDRSLVERRIVGALRSAVHAQGPVTDENISLAAKRVYAALKAVAREQR